MAEKNEGILQLIRELRNRQLVEKKDNSVFYTRIMEMPVGEKTGIQLYRFIEEYSTGKDQSSVRELFYRYEKKELKLVAISENGVLIDGLDVENERLTQEHMKEIGDIFGDIKTGKRKMLEEAKKQLKGKETEQLSELEIYKMLDAEAEKDDFRNMQGNKTTGEQQEEKETIIPKQQAEKRGIIGMNQIPLDQKVGTHEQTLRGEIGLDKDKYADIVALEIVPTYKLADLGGDVNKNPFSIVGKKQNGELVVFPEEVCKPYRGENDNVLTLDAKDDSIKTEKSDCIFEFPGKSASISIFRQSPYGIVDARLTHPTRDNEGRVGLNLQDDKNDGGVNPNNQGDLEKTDPSFRGQGFQQEIIKVMHKSEFDEAVEEIMRRLGLEREESKKNVEIALRQKIEIGMTIEEAINFIETEENDAYIGKRDYRIK